MFFVSSQSVEYTASALLDQALHGLDSAALKELDLADFEKKTLADLAMPAAILPRHRPAHFSHLFAGADYAAQYYVYLWAETLDADAFEAFEETSDIFDPATALRARACIYSAGNSVDPRATYRAFRGRDPTIEPMLKKKGML